MCLHACARAAFFFYGVCMVTLPCCVWRTVVSSVDRHRLIVLRQEGLRTAGIGRKHKSHSMHACAARTCGPPESGFVGLRAHCGATRGARKVAYLALGVYHVQGGRGPFHWAGSLATVSTGVTSTRLLHRLQECLRTVCIDPALSHWAIWLRIAGSLFNGCGLGGYLCVYYQWWTHTTVGCGAQMLRMPREDVADKVWAVRGPRSTACHAVEVGKGRPMGRVHELTFDVMELRCL